MCVDRTPIMYLGIGNGRWEVQDIQFNDNLTVSEVTIIHCGSKIRSTHKARKKGGKLELYIRDMWMDFEIHPRYD